MKNLRYSSPFKNEPSSPRNKLNLDIFSSTTPVNKTIRSTRSNFKNSLGIPTTSISTNLKSV